MMLSAQKRAARRGGKWMLIASAALNATIAGAATLRVVSYNIDDDTGGTSQTDARTNMTDLGVILQAIGSEHLAGNVQPIDVLALNELHYNNPSISTSLSAVANTLNSIYGAGTYAYDTTVGATNGNLSGNGPNGLIYNTKTVKDLGVFGLTKQADGVSTLVSGSAAPRQPMRYLLSPIGYDGNANFYIYVDHYKASSGSEARRQIEADAVRANADALGASAHIIYAGDFNLTGAGSQSNRTELGSHEPAYLDLTAAGNGQAVDPLNATNWDNTSAWTSTLTESGNDLTARFDFQLVSNAMLNQSGMQLVPGTYTTFGNSSTMTFGRAVNNSGNAAALTDLANRSQVLALLADKADVTDHLPIVADYSTVGVAPGPRFYVGAIAGTWNTTTSWSQNDRGATGASIPINGTVVTVDPSVNTTITFDSSYTGSGIGELHLNGAGGATATLNQSANTLDVAGAMFVGENAGTKGAYAISGGTLNVAGDINVGGSATVAGGTGQFTVNGGSVSATTLRVWTNGNVVVNAGTLSAAAINLSGGSMTLQSPGLTLTATSLTISATAKLDLMSDSLVIAYSGASPVGSIRTLLASGFNAGNWNGTGIASSTAHADATMRTALGYVDSGTSIRIKYTYYGDNNLDGKVDATDFQMFLDGLATNATSWSQGDYTYDGVVDLGNDFNLFLTGYINQGASLGDLGDAIAADESLSASQKAQLLQAVPEPASGVILLLGFCRMMSLRRRKMIVYCY